MFTPVKQRAPRIGAVTSVSLAESSCMVLVNEGEVPAYLTDQTIDVVAIGTVVTLLPVGDTYQVIATRGGTGSGGVGASYGPELVPNGGFEYGVDSSTTGWSRFPWASGDYFSARDVTPGEQVSGEARMLVTLNPGDTDPDVNVWTSSAIVVDDDVAYQGSVWVKASAVEATLAVTLRVITGPTASGAQYFGAGATATDLAVVAAPGAAYQLLTGLVTIPTGHHYARLFLRSNAAAAIAAPVSVSWDEASLRQRITS